MQTPKKVRVASVQYQLRGLSGHEEFGRRVAFFVQAAAGYAADFVVFPELYTLEILSAEATRLTAHEGMARITGLTDWYVGLLRELAVRHQINIVGGSHPTRGASGEIRNIAYFVHRDGRVETRDKIHPTPSEASVWGITGGDDAAVIETDCGPVGVLVCYDSEFPEPVRYLADQGALILFVPFCTDDRRGYLRVRYCCQARAVENQMYVVMSGVCGNLPNVENMDVNYAQGAILTPSDMDFARDGIAAEAALNSDELITADLDLEALARARREGTVRNFRDRRPDLYKVVWTPTKP
ncbi:MAG: carbon-nitrogen hydrolase family protein [Proteobacteria bacterium]|nr:carbon-nitrogen hydrolase family protein [Pseudomonadota bacterium]